MKFEDTAVDYFADGDIQQKTLTHPGFGDSKSKISETITLFKNPFREVYLWSKGEHLDIQGMIDAMNGRETVVKA